MIRYGSARRVILPVRFQVSIGGCYIGQKLPNPSSEFSLCPGHDAERSIPVIHLPAFVLVLPNPRDSIRCENRF